MVLLLQLPSQQTKGQAATARGRRTCFSRVTLSYVTFFFAFSGREASFLLKRKWACCFADSRRDKTPNSGNAPTSRPRRSRGEPAGRPQGRAGHAGNAGGAPALLTRKGWRVVTPASLATEWAWVVSHSRRLPPRMPLQVSNYSWQQTSTAVFHLCAPPRRQRPRRGRVLHGKLFEGRNANCASRPRGCGLRRLRRHGCGRARRVLQISILKWSY